MLETPEELKAKYPDRSRPKSFCWSRGFSRVQGMGSRVEGLGSERRSRSSRPNTLLGYALVPTRIKTRTAP
eukprot:1846158-Rhodomonas_salina.2